MANTTGTGTNVKTTSDLAGFIDPRFGGKVHHFRGIPYATVSERFAKPVQATDWRDHGPSFTKYGPLCPQPVLPYESMFGIKPAQGDQGGSEEAASKFDEFTCCNLNVTCPEIRGATASASRWPVYVWIHGGGQSVSFPPAQDRLGDPGPLVAQSVEMDKPVILVTFNYRLNVFGFADPEGVNVNLGMQDQVTAMRWVQDYIHLFGGDPVGLTSRGVPPWKSPLPPTYSCSGQHHPRRSIRGSYLCPRPARHGHQSQTSDPGIGLSVPHGPVRSGTMLENLPMDRAELEVEASAGCYKRRKDDRR